MASSQSQETPGRLKPCWLKSSGWGGYYVDANGNPIGVVAEEPGRLDSNEQIRACEAHTRRTLAAAGYYSAGVK